MTETYRHTQIGYWALGFLVPWVAAVLFVLIWGNPMPGVDIIFGLAGIVCAAIACFLYGMTISIDGTHINWHYGLGSFRKEVALEDILNVRIVDQLNMGGLGSRHTEKGMQYAVSFGRGIKLEVKTPWKKNKFIVLGSDEPEVLREALITQIHGRIELLGGEVPEAISFAKITDAQHIIRTNHDINEQG